MEILLRFERGIYQRITTLLCASCDRVQGTWVPSRDGVRGVMDFSERVVLSYLQLSVDHGTGPLGLGHKYPPEFVSKGYRRI